VPEEKENILEFPNLKGMHFIHVNARSILPKMSELRIMAKKSKAAVIAMFSLITVVHLMCVHMSPQVTRNSFICSNNPFRTIYTGIFRLSFWRAWVYVYITTS
jgi:hypothetical protein